MSTGIATLKARTLCGSNPNLTCCNCTRLWINKPAPTIDIAKLSIPRQSRSWSGGQKYNVIGLIGKGAFATVYKVATKSDGDTYAAKELEKRKFMKNGILDQKVENEMKIMSHLQHVGTRHMRNSASTYMESAKHRAVH